MNPFEQPPMGAPVSFEPPEPPPSGPRRGRMVLAAIVTVGLIGGGIAGLSQLASADRPDLAASATDDPTDETLPPADDDADEGAGTGDEAVEETDDDPGDAPESTVETDGQIVLETGEGDPIVIDLGEIGDGDLGQLAECIGLPMFDFDFDFDFGDGELGEFPIGDLDEFFDDLPFDLDALEEFDFDFGDFGAFDLDGGSVTVSGPDGVSVIDLGENGSVTITKDDGQVTISTDGDATVDELTDLFGEFGTIFDGDIDLGDFGFEEFLESFPTVEGGSLDALDDLPGFEPVNPDEVQSCLDEILSP